MAQKLFGKISGAVVSRSTIDFLQHGIIVHLRNRKDHILLITGISIAHIHHPVSEIRSQNRNFYFSFERIVDGNTRYSLYSVETRHKLVQLLKFVHNDLIIGAGTQIKIDEYAFGLIKIIGRQ